MAITTGGTTRIRLDDWPIVRSARVRSPLKRRPAAARAMPGVVDVVNLGDAVATVADGYWQAKQALAKIDIEWTGTDNDLQSSILKQIEENIKSLA